MLGLKFQPQNSLKCLHFSWNLPNQTQQRPTQTLSIWTSIYFPVTVNQQKSSQFTQNLASRQQILQKGSPISIHSTFLKHLHESLDFLWNANTVARVSRPTLPPQTSVLSETKIMQRQPRILQKSPKFRRGRPRDQPNGGKITRGMNRTKPAAEW